MYVACYCRVSTEEQKKYGYSIIAQKEALEKYCKENNYKYDFYIDEGISASSMKKRVQLNLMLSKAKDYDMILFTKLDRLSRNVLDANKINELLQQNKCTMKAIDEDDVDTSNADGMFIFNLKVSLAQREIGKTSERIKFVFESKRLRGEITSGSKKYGYDIVNKKLVINEEEAQNIINLYKYFINCGGSLKLTYEYFVQNFKGKGYDAMQNYLKDTAYIGKYKLYRKNEYLDNYIPQIVSNELFNKVQSFLTKCERKSVKNPTTALFKGIVICSCCGRKMHKAVDTRVKNLLIRYRCDGSDNYVVGSTEKQCNNRLIREDKIENYLLENIRSLAENIINQNTIVSVQKSNTSNQFEIKRIETKLNKLKELYLDELIDKETYRKDYFTLTNKLQDLKNETPKKEKDFSHIKSLINSNFETIYNTLNRDEKRAFWLNIIDKIYVENGEIKEVVFL